METPIVALRCPSCGNARNTVTKELRFGAEFRCESCGSTSVLVLNQQLVTRAALEERGEQVCVQCGRLALKEAQFCQGGHSLIRTCCFCARKFPINHELCDFCGRLQTDRARVEWAFAAMQDDGECHKAVETLVMWVEGTPFFVEDHGAMSVREVQQRSSPMTPLTLTDSDLLRIQQILEGPNPTFPYSDLARLLPATPSCLTTFARMYKTSYGLNPKNYGSMGKAASMLGMVGPPALSTISALIGECPNHTHYCDDLCKALAQIGPPALATIDALLKDEGRRKPPYEARKPLYEALVQIGAPSISILKAHVKANAPGFFGSGGDGDAKLALDELSRKLERER